MTGKLVRDEARKKNGERGRCFRFKAHSNYNLAPSQIYPLKTVPYVNTHAHTHICSVEGLCGGGTIDKGVLACGKGNHGAGAWVARVRVSAHTVWMWSSFPLLRKLRMNHMLPMPRSLLMHHNPPRHRSFQMKRCSSLMRRCSSPMRRHNFPKRHTFLAVRMLLVRHTLVVPHMSLGVQWLWWRPVPVWWLVVVEEVAEEEEGWCRHTGDTGTVAGTVDTVGIDAFAGSTLSKT